MKNDLVKIFFIKFLLILTSISFADDKIAKPEKFCIKNEKEFLEKKALMPAIIQTLPIFIGAETTKMFSDVIVVLNIAFQDEAIVIKTDIWKLGARYQDIQEIKKACFDLKKKTMKLDFVNDSDLEIKFSDHGFVAQGVTLNRLTVAQRIEYENKIIKKEQASSRTQVSETKPQNEVNK